MTRGQCCNDCAYYVPRVAEVEVRADVRGDGECHHGPPHAAHGWPKVERGDWCGRFRTPMPDPPPPLPARPVMLRDT